MKPTARILCKGSYQDIKALVKEKEFPIAIFSFVYIGAPEDSIIFVDKKCERLIIGNPYRNRMKKEIRTTILKKRNGMLFSEVLEKSERIKEQIFHTGEFKDAKTVLFYVSYDNEVYTHEMIKESLEKKKQVVVPKLM